MGIQQQINLHLTVTGAGPVRAFTDFIRPNDQSNPSPTVAGIGDWLRAVSAGTVAVGVSGTLTTSYSGSAPTGGVGSSVFSFDLR